MGLHALTSMWNSDACKTDKHACMQPFISTVCVSLTDNNRRLLAYTVGFWEDPLATCNGFNVALAMYCNNA